MNYRPLKVRPFYKEYLWGGERLKKEYRKVDAPSITAESWELSAHPAGMTALLDIKTQKVKTLQELEQIDHKGFWGTSCQTSRFPILVKLIDATKDLSIQVHPSDETADAKKGENGKAEMWYIVDCEPQAYIYFGFSKTITKGEFLRHVRDGTICEVLNRVPVKKGDVFYILPGTIHAIGAGIVIAEIQQNSNTTFRVFDYNRRDKDGNLRPLQVERAAEVLDYTPVVPAECKANAKAEFPGFALTEMFSCRYFKAYKLDIQTTVDLTTDGESFRHLLCVGGSGEIITESGKYSISRGESYFIPANLGEYKISGDCRILLSLVSEEER